MTDRLDAPRLASPALRPLEGRRAVVTGASQGIGAAVAVAFAGAGADVVGLAPARRRQRARGRGRGRGARAPRRPARRRRGRPGRSMDHLADTAASELGGIDIWVNNAARLMVRPFLETTDEDWHGLLAANLHGYFYGCRAAARAMRERRRADRQHVLGGATSSRSPSCRPTPRPRARSWPHARARGRARAARGSRSTRSRRARSTPRSTPPPTRRRSGATYAERIPLGRIASAGGGRRRRRLPRLGRRALRHRPGAGRRRRADGQRHVGHGRT